MKLLHLSKFTFLSLLILTVFSACESDADDSLSIPDAYQGQNFETNAAIELQVLAQLGALVDEMKTGRSEGVTVDATQLATLFTTGAPSVSDITTPYYRSLLSGENGVLAQLASNSGTTFTLTSPPSSAGVYGAYLFNEFGLELEQVVEKGLFGAALYNHFLTLAEDGVTEAEVDRMLAIFGANPTFTNSNNGTLHERPDRFAAVYAARRDKNDGNGFYTTMRDEFIRLQAAVKAGADYEADRDEALSSIKALWEKSSASTVIHYLITTISRLSATSPTDAEISGALHAYAEGVGFLHGWKTIPSAHKTITDAQIDELLVLMNAPATGNASSYLFATNPSAELPKLQQVNQQLQSIYGFSDAEMTDFANNWINVQGR